VRRIRRAIACLACCRKFSEGNYDERFRLQLLKNFSSSNFSAVKVRHFFPAVMFAFIASISFG
jgi:hypothetical protein